MTDRSDFEADSVRFLNLSHDLICIAGMDGYMKYVNPACEAKLGYPEAEILATPFIELIHPDDRAKTEAEVVKLSAGIETLDFENRYVTKTGEILHIAWTAAPLPEEARIYCIGRDITDRRLAEEAMQESVQRLELATAAARVASWDWDLRNDGLHFSPEWKAQLGYEDHEIENRFEEWESRLHPDEREEILGKVEDYLAGRIPEYVIEFRLRHKDGSYRWIYTRAEKQLDDAGQAARVMGCHIDVTERRETQLALRESEERLRNLMEQSPVSIQIHDLDGKLSDSNDGFARLYALSDAALEGLYEKYNLLEDEQAEKKGLMPYIRKPFDGEDVTFPPYQYDGIDTLRTLDIDDPVSRTCWVQTKGFPLRNDRGEVVRAVFMSEDITEQKRAEAELIGYQKRLQALGSQLIITEERERQQIATELHDEVGQNLASARLQIASVLKACTDPALAGKLKELSATILQATRDTRHLVYNLSSPSLRELGLKEAIAEQLEEGIGNRHGLETHFESDGHHWPLGGDVKALLFRNVRELLTNVVKHAGAGRVTVRMECREGIGRIVVEDDGCGFDVGAETFRTSREGGFGLFSIRERMISMAGDFELESKPGEGCRAVLSVPCPPTDEGPKETLIKSTSRRMNFFEQ